MKEIWGLEGEYGPPQKCGGESGNGYTTETGTERDRASCARTQYECGGSPHMWAGGRTEGLVTSRKTDGEGLATSRGQKGDGLPVGLCWGVGVSVWEGEGEGEDEPDDLVLRGGTRACWAVREAEGPCRGPWEVFMGGG